MKNEKRVFTKKNAAQALILIIALVISVLRAVQREDNKNEAVAVFSQSEEKRTETVKNSDTFYELLGW